jgi:hypothetical protein
MFAVSGPSAYGVMVRLFPLMCSRRQARMRELMEGFESVKATVYRIENVVTGDIQEVTKLKQWLQAHGLSETGLWRTLVGERKQCKGWRRLS